jgi:CubicO group peptidase (beta-lactamase class C family)
MARAAADEEPYSHGVGRDPAVASATRVLESWLESQLAYRGLPGLSIGIVLGEDLIWARGFGYSDVLSRTPATRRTQYPLASISKLLTATAVLQLRDRGRLRLDDPVADHLKWFRLRTWDPDDPPITIRQLLTHTSGVPRDAPFPYHTDYKYPTREQWVESVRTIDPVYPPETKWKYSNLGFAILGEIVAAASGLSFDRYVQDCVLGPLGMRNTPVRKPHGSSAAATCYGRRMPDGDRAFRPALDAVGFTAAAGYWSTVEDLAKFASLQFATSAEWGEQILKASTLREMHRVHWLNPDWDGGWGLGFQVIPGETRDLVGHDGWAPGCQSAIYVSLPEEIGVVVQVNSDDGNPYPRMPESIIDRAFEWVAPAINRVTTPEEKPKKPAAAWRKYCGLYRDPWEDSEVLVLDGELAMIRPTDADPPFFGARLVPAGPHTFRLEGGDPFAEHGELVVFELGKNGQVTRMKVGPNYSDRVNS